MGRKAGEITAALKKLQPGESYECAFDMSLYGKCIRIFGKGNYSIRTIQDRHLVTRKPSSSAGPASA